MLKIIKKVKIFWKCPFAEKKRVWVPIAEDFILGYSVRSTKVTVGGNVETIQKWPNPCLH